jgi:hypothetical protein
MKTVIAVCSGLLLLAACAGGGGDAGSVSGPPSGGGGTIGNGGADFTTPWTGDESDEPLVVLTGSSPQYLDQTPFTLNQTTTVSTFTSAQFTAQFWVLDFANAQRFLNGQSFSGFRMLPAGQSGYGPITLPAGTYYMAVQPNQTVFPSYSNEVFMEVSWGRYPKWVANGGITVVEAGSNPGAWRSLGFTVPTGDFRARIETEGSAGTFAVMSNAQFQAFSAQNPSGFTGGTISFLYACGNQTGGADLEIECDLSLPPGNYVLIYINTADHTAGGAGVIQYFLPQ